MRRPRSTFRRFLPCLKKPNLATLRALRATRCCLGHFRRRFDDPCHRASIRTLKWARFSSPVHGEVLDGGRCKLCDAFGRGRCRTQNAVARTGCEDRRRGCDSARRSAGTSAVLLSYTILSATVYIISILFFALQRHKRRCLPARATRLKRFALLVV